MVGNDWLMGPPVPGTAVSKEKADKIFEMWDAFWEWCHAKHDGTTSKEDLKVLERKHLDATKAAGFEID